MARLGLRAGDVLNMDLGDIDWTHASVLQMSRPDLHEELKGGAGASISHGRRRRFTSNALVVAEIALSLMLLVSAGLLLKDFALLRSLDIGVRREGVWTAAVMLPDVNYKTGRQKYDFSEALLERGRRIAGADAVALSDHLPLEGGSNYYVKLRGQTTEESNQLVEMHAISPDYFRALGVRVLQGRVFTSAHIQLALANDIRLRQLYEGDATPPADQTDAIVSPCVINESMARFFWPRESPLGKMFSQGNDHGPWRRVAGVVGDVPEWSLTQKTVPEAYDPFDGRARQFLILHTSLPPSSMTAQARRALVQVDPSLPLVNIRTMDEVVAEQAQGQQFLSVLVGSFAGLAALLAAIGSYGVLSYLVTQRTREIGIRMALGSPQKDVTRLFLWHGLRLSALGVACGLAGAVASTRLMSSLLFQVSPLDPLTYAGVSCGLVAAAALASYLPALRATGIDPVEALRAE